MDTVEVPVKVTLVKFEHEFKKVNPKVIPLGIERLVIFWQFWNIAEEVKSNGGVMANTEFTKVLFTPEPEKHPSPNVVTLVGIITLVKLVQLLKMYWGIDVKVLFKTTFVKLEQFWNIEVPKLVTLEISICCNAEHPLNARGLIVLTNPGTFIAVKLLQPENKDWDNTVKFILVGRVIWVKSVHPLNTLKFIKVTEFGIAISVKLEQLLNAYSFI